MAEGGYGFFEKRRMRSNQRKRARERSERNTQKLIYLDQLEHWEAERDRLAQNLALAQKPSVLKKDEVLAAIDMRLGIREFAIGALHGEGRLIEVEAAPGQIKGGIGGVSVGFGGVSVGLGRHSGRIEPSKAKLTVTDTGGDVIITNRQLVYRGQIRAFRWKLRSVDTVDDSPFIPEAVGGEWYQTIGYQTTYFSTTDREYVSGIGYPTEHATWIRSRLRLAMALATGERRDHAKELEAELAAYDATRPQPPPE